MEPRKTAAPLAALALCALSAPAFAQAADAPAATVPAAAAPAAKHAAVHKKAHAKAPAKPAAAPAARAAPAAPSIVGAGDGASLERRRRAFFGSRPDEDAPEQEAPRAGVTLGGSGGLKPGMGFSF